MIHGSGQHDIFNDDHNNNNNNNNNSNNNNNNDDNNNNNNKLINDKLYLKITKLASTKAQRKECRQTYGV